MCKITLDAEKLYLIRSTSIFKDGTTEVRYYEAPSCWNKSPMHCVIFTDYDQAVGHLQMYHKRDKAPKGWADGRTEYIDVVPMYHEILLSPNSIEIEIKKDE